MDNRMDSRVDIRSRKINTLFPISCLEKIGSVGREMFFLS